MAGSSGYAFTQQTFGFQSVKSTTWGAEDAVIVAASPAAVPVSPGPGLPPWTLIANLGGGWDSRHLIGRLCAEEGGLPRRAGGWGQQQD